MPDAKEATSGGRIPKTAAKVRIIFGLSKNNLNYEYWNRGLWCMAGGEQIIGTVVCIVCSFR